MHLAGEFAKAVNAATRGSGVLLSGPNGVGKSGVGLLSYLLCAARRLPVVYLSRTETWVLAAQQGQGDDFLLSAFWEQNADLIAASEPLRAVFAAALRDEAGALTSHVIDALRRTARRHRLGIGVILDEVQHITAAVMRLSAPAASQSERTAALYFCNSWHDWMNDNSAFVRMSIASAHGERDYKLPSGEDHRLRIVEPLTDDQREALQSHPASPAFVSDLDARKRIVFYSGNILRAIMNAGCALPVKSPSALNTELSHRLGRLHVAMEVDCRRWLASLPEHERAAVAMKSMDLLSGKMRWTDAKGLFDAGIMYCPASSFFLRPVSAWASAAYLSCTAQYIRGAAKPLSSFADGRIRGYELEQQVLASLERTDVWVSTKLLSGQASDALHLRSSYALPFDLLGEVVLRDVPVLYRPVSLTFPCDGILMPAIDDAEGAIIVLECSTSSPRIERRADKVRGYLQPDGVVGILAEHFPTLPCFVVLVYDGDLAKKKVAVAKKKVAVAAVALATPDTATPTHSTTASVRIIDRSSLIQLGNIVL